jgi:hypothetical protein
MDVPPFEPPVSGLQALYSNEVRVKGCARGETRRHPRPLRYFKYGSNNQNDCQYRDCASHGGAPTPPERASPILDQFSEGNSKTHTYGKKRKIADTRNFAFQVFDSSVEIHEHRELVANRLVETAL